MIVMKRVYCEASHTHKMKKLKTRRAHRPTLSSRPGGLNNKDLPGVQDDLRRRAEEALQGQPASAGKLSDDDIQRLIHELRVHQIELEMQNEELRLAQEAIEAARDRYFDLFDLAPVGYLLLSETGTVLAANLASASLLGIERNRLENSPMSRYIFIEDQDIFYFHRRKVLQDNIRQEFELRLVRKDGSRVDVHMDCVSIQEQSWPTSQMRVILSDITERKQHERTLKTYVEKLEVLNQELDGFASIASHDLQEPLQKIKGFGEILKRNYSPLLDEMGRDYIDRMQAAAGRMERLIQDLLTLSRLSTQDLEFRRTDLNCIARDVLGDLEGRIKRTGGQVEIGELPIVIAVPIQMQQLFINLIGNALKYHKPGIPPLVKVDALPVSTGVVEIRFFDNGIGFEEQAAKKIFKPFVRLHGRSEYEGTGIGLAICERIIENHGGKITARSAPGQGATFIVQLPIRQPGFAEG
jgi:chemotaxis family two-component system sensor kinase Cph1